MDPVDARPTIGVRVAYSPRPEWVEQVELRLAPGSTVREALKLSGLLAQHALRLEALTVGVWCRVCGLDTTLRDRDRVEVYRPLRVDPKEARRQRYKGRQGKDAAARVKT